MSRCLLKNTRVRINSNGLHQWPGLFQAAYAIALGNTGGPRGENYFAIIGHHGEKVYKQFWLRDDEFELMQTKSIEEWE